MEAPRTLAQLAPSVGRLGAAGGAAASRASAGLAAQARATVRLLKLLLLEPSHEDMLPFAAKPPRGGTKRKKAQAT
eukprot:4700954-Prymnesium_polylepis.1